MSDEKMRAGVIEMSPEILTDWLDFPEGHRITGFRWDPVRWVLEARMEGPMMPEVDPACELMRVRPTYRRKEHEMVKLEVVSETGVVIDSRHVA